MDAMKEVRRGSILLAHDDALVRGMFSADGCGGFFLFFLGVQSSHDLYGGVSVSECECEWDCDCDYISMAVAVVVVVVPCPFGRTLPTHSLTD